MYRPNLSAIHTPLSDEEEAVVQAEFEAKERLYALEKAREEELLISRYHQGVKLRLEKQAADPSMNMDDYDEDVGQLLEEADFVNWDQSNFACDLNAEKDSIGTITTLFQRRKTSAEIFFGGILNQGLCGQEPFKKGEELFFLTRRHEFVKAKLLSIGYDGSDAVYGIQLLTRKPIVTASRHLFRELYRTESELNQVPLLVDGRFSNMGFFFTQEYVQEINKGFTLEYTRLKKAPCNDMILVKKDGTPANPNIMGLLHPPLVLNFYEVDGYADFQMNAERSIRVSIDCIMRVLRFKLLFEVQEEGTTNNMVSLSSFGRRDENTAVQVEYRYVIRDARTGMLYNVSSQENKLSPYVLAQALVI